jgi:hypothetical protein
VDLPLALDISQPPLDDMRIVCHLSLTV